MRELIKNYSPSKRKGILADSIDVEPKDVEVEELDSIEQDSIEQDSIELDTATSEAETYGLFSEILAILNAVLKGDKNTEAVIEGLIEGLDEKEEDALFDLFGKVMTYLKIPDDAYDSLLDEDEDISKEELGNLKEIISQAVGEHDLYSFVYNAIFNPYEPKDKADVKADAVVSDAIMMDWSFFPTKGKCFAHKSGNKASTKKLACIFGVSDGKKGSWLFPKDFEDKETGGVSGANHKSKTKVGYSTHKWGSSGLNKYKRSMKKRNAATEKTSKRVGV